MKILIAEDEAVSRLLLKSTLTRWGHDVLVTSDGEEAWNVLRAGEAPRLLVLDWMMPGVNGVDLCRRIRETAHLAGSYVILLTAKGERSDLVTGLEAGADDYITKPFDREELRARIHVGVRVVDLQSRLADRVRELEDALSRVKRLQGLLPICAYCKKIRNDRNYWEQVEHYVAEHSGAQFSHGICPDCYENIVTPSLNKLKEERSSTDDPR